MEPTIALVPGNILSALLLVLRNSIRILGISVFDVLMTLKLIDLVTVYVYLPYARQLPKLSTFMWIVLAVILSVTPIIHFAVGVNTPLNFYLGICTQPH